MAVTKIHPIKTTLNKAIDYICNPDKTDNQILISSYGCSYQTADIEFGFTLSKARDKGDNLGHHLIQSFAPGEVSYEEAHRIGKELADKVLGGKYDTEVPVLPEGSGCSGHLSGLFEGFALDGRSPRPSGAGAWFALRRASLV